MEREEGLPLTAIFLRYGNRSGFWLICSTFVTAAVGYNREQSSGRTTGTICNLAFISEKGKPAVKILLNTGLDVRPKNLLIKLLIK
jgi:hypothetical protein